MSIAQAQDRAVVPQHLCLVLPSSGEFDSRMYRIATTCVARGHRVTVLARWTAGLPLEEDHQGGYRIVRVPASSADGLPLRGLGRRLVAGYRRARGRAGIAGAERAFPATPSGPGDDLAGDATSIPAAGTSPARRASLPRRVVSGAVRRFAIPLTIRSHVRNATATAPAADLYHGMAYMGIPVALALGRRHRAPVVYDARDIYLEARNLARMRGPARWALARLERGWAHRAGRVVTVNRAYAEVMRARWRLDPLVVMNCSYRFDPPEPPERRFHDALGLASETRVVLYHGGLFPQRGIEQLVAAIPDLPGAALVLMGYGVLEPELWARAATPGLVGRMFVLPAVPPQDLHAWVACADVAVMPIQPSTLNHRLTTPNKLFEAMAAGVPVVASDLPGMASIVHQVGFGVLCDPTDAAAVGAAVRDVLDAGPERRASWREAAVAAARGTYNWETQADVLLAEYTRLTGKRW